MCDPAPVGGRSAAAWLARQQLRAVRYHVLQVAGQPEDWDLGGVHSATMGVELDTTGGTCVITWMQSDIDFSLAIVTDDGINREVATPELSAHPWWLPLRERPLQVDLVAIDGRRGPVGVVLRADTATVYLFAAEQEIATDGSVTLVMGMDAVTVTPDCTTVATSVLRAY